MTTTTPWLRRDVQGLRAIAVLLVVTFHAGLPIPGGFVGVDVFFVISGFVITGLILRQQADSRGFRLREFYTRRMKRLLPALAVMTSVTLLVAIFLESPFGPQRTTALTGLGASLFVANFVIYANTGGYFDAPAEANPLLHTWSLSVEEQFYFVFPALMILIATRALTRGRDKRTIALITISAIALASLAASILLGLGLWTPGLLDNPVDWAFYSSVTRAWEFCAGAIVALAIRPGASAPRPYITTLLALVGAVAVVTSAFVITPDTVFPGYAALLPVLGTAAVILAGSWAPTNLVSRGLGLSVLVWIGAVSYSWYLWHWPVIVYTGQILPGNTNVLLLAGALSLLPAWLAYRFIENPIRTSYRLRGPRALMVIGAAILVPAAIAWGVLEGSQRSWGNSEIKAMSEQIQPVPVSFTRGCDNGVPLGQQDGLDCTWHLGARATPVYLVGDSQAAQFAEGFIDATLPLERPLTIATAGSCPFLTTAPDEEPLQTPECQDFVDRSVDWLDTQSPATVIIGMSGNYITPEYAGEIERRLTRTVATLQQSGHDVVLMQAIPQFLGWTPFACTVFDVVSDPVGCGTSVPRTQMDLQQADALRIFRTVVESTGAPLIDVRPQLCAQERCQTNIRDQWRYRDMFHISVGESTRLTPVLRSELLNN